MYETALIRPTLVYMMSGIIYEKCHQPISNANISARFDINIRDYWDTHMKMVAALSHSYTVKTAVVTYNTSNIISQWVRNHVDGFVTLDRDITTQIMTRIYGLIHFRKKFNAKYYVITRIDIQYLPRTIHALRNIIIRNDSVLALHTFLGDYINDVFFAFERSSIPKFIFCTTQSRRHGATAGEIPIDSHELNMCMKTSTVFGKQWITVRTPNDMYKLPGYIRTPLFVYYVTDIFTSMITWSL